MQKDVAIIKKAVLQGSPMNVKVGLKVQVLEPKSFNGNRDAKELENCLLDMEKFFKAAHVPKGEKVSIASTHLTRNVKL